jgi:hypothetical protein
MILVAAFLAVADPAPLSLQPFMDEDVAARAMEEHLNCLGGGAFERRGDMRDVKDVAADIVTACRAGAAKLRAALEDVYRRKPKLLSAGQTPETAADYYVNRMNSSVELVIIQNRKQK